MMATLPAIRQEPTKQGGHKYYVEGDELIDPSRSLISCSTIAKYASSGDSDGLIYWGVDLALKHGHRDAFRDFRDQAMSVGHAIHSEISEYISSEKPPKVEQSMLFGKWYSSMHEKGIEWLATELMVYNADLTPAYGGTIDAIGVVDGVVTLFDWKTTNGLTNKGYKKKLGDSSHATQVAGYSLALKSQYRNGNSSYRNLIPEKAVICYLLKDTHEVAWRYVDLDKAELAFTTCHQLYSLNSKEGLYETR
tara:strand:+ start:972 stop:1721 length:750 start_codon:yes stop_codon:yes gene_type:complete